MLDLSALDVTSSLENGKPLEIALDLIDEDPEQPRKEFSEESLKEMQASIKLRGIKSPVSVRPNPDAPGRWILNYGARRFRGSRMAGKATIPAFVDDNHDSYDQVLENIQREDLKPMELALFIQRRMNAGDKKNEIARRLSKNGSIITYHLALIDAPECVEDAYASGKCTSARTLYELRALHEKHPEEVSAWYADAGVIDRATVSALAEKLAREKAAPPPPEEPVIEPSKPTEPTPETVAVQPKPDEKPPEHEADKSAVAVQPKPDEKPFEHEADKSAKLKNPVLMVKYNKRNAMVLLHRRPSETGLIHIRFEEGDEEEVSARACLIDLLTEGR
ncbi:MAG: ParB/RepB/Spo0J family partition protein [Candidatus Accumulibacter sp.]|jgi:ParB family chromosome partitioning protein|nr:ParB/RepB/Spo0J family partition protein [Accumulibacter sp.]